MRSRAIGPTSGAHVIAVVAASEVRAHMIATTSNETFAQRGSDKHLHYSRGVTVEEMRQARGVLAEVLAGE